MTKTKLVEEVARMSNSTKKATDEVMKAFIKVIEREVVAGRDITITGLGTFKKSNRKERQGRNPYTGEMMTISASKSVSFKVAKSLKEKLN